MGICFPICPGTGTRQRARWDQPYSSTWWNFAVLVFKFFPKILNSTISWNGWPYREMINSKNVLLHVHHHNRLTSYHRINRASLRSFQLNLRDVQIPSERPSATTTQWTWLFISGNYFFSNKDLQLLKWVTYLLTYLWSWWSTTYLLTQLHKS